MPARYVAAVAGAGRVDERLRFDDEQRITVELVDADQLRAFELATLGTECGEDLGAARAVARRVLGRRDAAAQVRHQFLLERLGDLL